MKKLHRDVQFQSLTAHTWVRFKQNKPALVGLWIIGIAILVVLGGPFLRPDASPQANNQALTLAAKPPGFTVEVLQIVNNKEAVDQHFLSKWAKGIYRNYTEVPVYAYELENDELLVELYTGFEPNNGERVSYKLVDILYPVIGVKQLAADEWKVDLANGESLTTTNEAMWKKIRESHLIERTFLLGTDRFGRDLLSRLMSGTVISLSVGVIAVGISVLLGLFLGALAGYYRGYLDQVIMWFINVVWSIPTLMLVIAITLVLGKGYWQVFIAVGLTMWVEVARVVRGQVLSLREKEYVEAARVLGYSDARIVFKHLLPNVLSPVIVISAANFASAILIEAGLSFLGLGAQPPQASWGRMISEHKGFIVTGDAYMALFPGLAIMLMVLAFMLIGNGLRDALDSKTVLVAKT